MSDIDVEDPDTGELDEYEQYRPPARRLRRVGIVVLCLGLIFLLVAAVAGVWVAREINPPGPPGEKLTVSIERGSSTADIGRQLEDEGVITNATVFRYYVRVRSAGPFQAGEFTFRRNQAMGDVVSTLNNGPQAPPFDLVTVPEGFILGQISERLAKGAPALDRAELDRVMESGSIRSRYQPDGVTKLEGLLFPDTYRVEERDDESTVVQRMVSQLDSVAGDLGYDNADQTVGYSPYEVIVVASLVEREAKVDADRGKVARVIYNRLAKGIPLGVDASVLYAVGKTNGLTRSDLEIDSPYNTRIKKGLPPTPIAAPGSASLDAALHPSDGDWLYYVLGDGGEHVFTADYNEFLRAKDECERKGLGCG
jgi:UPF0755 protein